MLPARRMVLRDLCREFARRVDHGAIPVRDGALGRRIEDVDRGDAPVLEGDPQGMVERGRENVEHGAAQDHFTRLVDPAFLPVGERGEAGHHLLRVHRRTDRDVERIADVRRNDALDHGGRCGDHHAWRVPGLGHAAKRRHPSAHRGGRRRGPVVGQAIPWRQEVDCEFGMGRAKEAGDRFGP